MAEVLHRRAPLQAVGRFQADDPHPTLTDLLGDLSGDGDGVALELDVELHGEVDLGNGVGGELDVDDGAGDGDDAAVLQDGGIAAGAEVGDGHANLSYYRDRCYFWGDRASAPLTISMISVVMLSCRARLRWRVSLVMSSSALSDAEAMAGCCAARNDADASSRAPKTRAST